jgi:hypothetical protein
MNKNKSTKTKPNTEFSNKNSIQLYLHCSLCVGELPRGMSPSSYQSIEAGWTAQGLQVWCKRHDCNILHIDFEGQKHPAISTRSED